MPWEETWRVPPGRPSDVLLAHLLAGWLADSWAYSKADSLAKQWEHSSELLLASTLDDYLVYLAMMLVLVLAVK